MSACAAAAEAVQVVKVRRRRVPPFILYPYAVACRCALPSCREKLHSNCLPLLRLLQGELSSCVCSGAAL